MAQRISDEDASYGSGSIRRQTTLDTIKDRVADKMKAAAAAIDERSQQAVEGKSSLGGYRHRASEWLDHSADYLRDADVERIKGDLNNEIKRHPGRSLAIAGAVGLFLGVLLRRR